VATGVTSVSCVPVQRDLSTSSEHKAEVEKDPDQSLIKLNHGRRIDYALPITTLEAANEYFSSMSSHSSYFGNPDVSLFLLRIMRGHVEEW
jgi:hypothetical protein